MAITNFTSLDFEQIKSNIKEHLRSNSNFTDYDFEGSTLAVVVDILAYNTYISAYNANMLSNEVFIDSATLRENVVSLARNIGYIPRSKKAAEAMIRFSIDTSNFPVKPRSITLSKGSVALNANSLGSRNLSFCIPEDVTAVVTEGKATFDNLKVYEGTLIKEEFTVDTDDLIQRFILGNAGIDYSTIRVTVKDNAFVDDRIVYTMADSITEIDGTTKVFFIQEIEDERYELIFGDGIFANKLQDGNLVEVSYITTNGAEGNDASAFRFVGNLTDNDGRVISRDISRLTTLSSSKNGSSIESVESIKNYATRTYASQNRAVTSSDYETIIRRIYPETDSITAFGGEELRPPRYGKVFIAIKPKSGLFVANSLKDSIKRELRKYSMAGIIPELIDTNYVFVECSSTIYYNPNKVSDQETVLTDVTNALTKFSEGESMNMYGSRFRYSQFTSIIDNANKAITSNITEIRIRRDMRSILNRMAEYEICFGNSFKILNTSGFNIKSSGFKVSGINKTVYFSDIPKEDGLTGELVLISVPEQPLQVNDIEDDLPQRNDATIMRRNVGVVDYVKGEINISAINITSTIIKQNSSIEISACPSSNDVIGLQDLFLQFDVSQSNLTVISDTILSGADPTGSDYIITPTYASDYKVIREASSDID